MNMQKIKRDKVQVDAAESTVGRVASRIASLLIGKTKVGYVPYIDSGAKVIVTNIAQVHFSGKKATQKVYRHHSMHPGGLKEVAVKDVLKERPEEVILHAVWKMLPRNKFREERMKRLSFK